MIMKNRKPKPNPKPNPKPETPANDRNPDPPHIENEIPNSKFAPPKGRRDHSAARLTRHALRRFVERFRDGQGDPDDPETQRALRNALANVRRIGRNPRGGAVAILAIADPQAPDPRPMVAILADDAVATVLTWPQFLPRFPDFGRPNPPQKPGRSLRRLRPPNPADDPPPSEPEA